MGYDGTESVTIPIPFEWLAVQQKKKLDDQAT